MVSPNDQIGPKWPSAMAYRFAAIGRLFFTTLSRTRAISLASFTDRISPQKHLFHLPWRIRQRSRQQCLSLSVQLYVTSIRCQRSTVRWMYQLERMLDGLRAIVLNVRRLHSSASKLWLMNSSVLCSAVSSCLCSASLLLSDEYPLSTLQKI